MISTVDARPMSTPGQGRPTTRLRLFAFYLLSATMIAVGGCGGDDAPEQGNRGSGGGGKSGGRGAGKDSPIHVAVSPVTRGTVVSRYTTTATLEAKNRASIEARAAGLVEALLVEEGDRVEANQVLLHLEDTQARLRLQKAEINLRQEQTMFGRQKASLDREVITQAEYDLAEAAMEAAQAERDLTKDDLSHTRVRAPFAGRIIARQVDLGQTVSIGAELFTIANFTPMLARVHVPGKEIGSLQVGQPVSIVLDSNKQELHGSVDLISPVIDPATGTIKVTVKIDSYPEGTRPGDFAHVTIVTESHENVMRVPNNATYEDRGDQIVYVASDSIATRRVVETGFVDDDFTEVLSGVADGERVVVKGQRSLRDQAAIIILETPKEPTAETLSAQEASAQSREGS
jgi:membrane fusion protein (multidrug efflux system)